MSVYIAPGIFNCPLCVYSVFTSERVIGFAYASSLLVMRTPCYRCHVFAAVMCLLFVDKFAGCVLFQLLVRVQTHLEDMEQTSVTLQLTYGASLRMT